MLLLCVWPPDPLSNVCLGSFETQHIYLQCGEGRGRSSCQNKVIVLLTASSALEGQLWQTHNVAVSGSPGPKTVICGHAGNPAAASPRSVSLSLSLYFLKPSWIISLPHLEMFFISVYQDVSRVTWGNSFVVFTKLQTNHQAGTLCVISFLFFFFFSLFLEALRHVSS